MTRKLNMNDSLCNLGKAVWHRRKTKITVLNINVTYYLIFKFLKNEKYKISHYSPILQGCMNTRSRRETFRSFLILLDGRSSSTIVVGNLASNTNTKKALKLRGKPNPGSSQNLRR